MTRAEQRKRLAEQLGLRLAERYGWTEVRPEVVEQLTRHMSRGNLKLDSSTAIWNPGGAAADCVSAQLGLCQLPDIGLCYARKAERYPGPLAYRRRQAELQSAAEPVELAAAVLELEQRYRVRSWRLSESGDFRDAADLAKVTTAADMLRDYGSRVRPYCYTARRDLDYPDPAGSALVVNGSGWTPPGGNVFRAERLADIPPGSLVCPGRGCGRECSLCLRQHGRTVYVLLH